MKPGSEYRGPNGSSQQELAKRLAVTGIRIRSIERGRLLPNILLVCDIAELFRTSISEIFTRCP
jgi:DNA-binding XRE family transcriptional regulator